MSRVVIWFTPQAEPEAVTVDHAGVGHLVAGSTALKDRYRMVKVEHPKDHVEVMYDGLRVSEIRATNTTGTMLDVASWFLEELARAQLRNAVKLPTDPSVVASKQPTTGILVPR